VVFCTKGAVAFDDTVGEGGGEKLSLPFPAFDLPGEPLLVEVGRQLVKELLDWIEVRRVVARIDGLD
jgi:hypothetical protein